MGSLNMHRALGCVLSTILAIAVIAVLGCGGGVGDVSGKVVFKGKPVPAGTVTIFGTQGRIAVGPINPDGTYSVVGVPAGKTTITVNSHPPSQVYMHDRNGRPKPLPGQPAPGQYV